MVFTLPFFLLYAATIVVSRVALWLKPRHAPKIGGFQLHHFMYGLVLIAAFFIFSEWWLLAIGIALFVDEVPLFFIFRGFDWPDDHWKQYQSWHSVAAIMGITTLGYMSVSFL